MRGHEETGKDRVIVGRKGETQGRGRKAQTSVGTKCTRRSDGVGGALTRKRVLSAPRLRMEKERLAGAERRGEAPKGKRW